MQMNRTGVGLIGFFLLAGLALCVVPLLLGASAEVALIIASTGAIWVLVALGLLWYSQHQKKKGAHQDEVFKTGLRGRATVLDVSSHAEVNEMPVMKLKLELDIPGHGKRRASKRETMPVFAARRMEAGLVLPVYVNPEDAEDFVLVW
jgi:hypothetical protein